MSSATPGRLTGLVARQWVANTGVVCATSLQQNLASLHLPTGVVHLLRFALEEMKFAIKPSPSAGGGGLSMKDLATYVDFLTCVLLDLVDAPSPAILDHLDVAKLWSHLEAMMATLLLQLREQAKPDRSEWLLPLLTTANRMLALLRIAHVRLPADTASIRDTQLLTWVSATVHLRKDLQARSFSTVPLDELPSGTYVYSTTATSSWR